MKLCFYIVGFLSRLRRETHVAARQDRRIPWLAEANHAVGGALEVVKATWRTLRPLGAGTKDLVEDEAPHIYQLRSSLDSLKVSFFNVFLCFSLLFLHFPSIFPRPKPIPGAVQSARASVQRRAPTIKADPPDSKHASGPKATGLPHRAGRIHASLLNTA